jgi:hypothetical protein
MKLRSADASVSATQSGVALGALSDADLNAFLVHRLRARSPKRPVPCRPR